MVTTRRKRKVTDSYEPEPTGTVVSASHKTVGAQKAAGLEAEMGVVALRADCEPLVRPTSTVAFCVQAFWLDRERLVKGAFEQHANMEAALRAGKRLVARAPAVLVYRVRGSVETQHWEEPVVIARLGDAREDLPPPPAPGLM